MRYAKEKARGTLWHEFMVLETDSQLRLTVSKVRAYAYKKISVNLLRVNLWRQADPFPCPLSARSIRLPSDLRPRVEPRLSLGLSLPSHVAQRIALPERMYPLRECLAALCEASDVALLAVKCYPLQGAIFISAITTAKQ